RCDTDASGIVMWQPSSRPISVSGGTRSTDGGPLPSTRTRREGIRRPRAGPMGETRRVVACASSRASIHTTTASKRYMAPSRTTFPNGPVRRSVTRFLVSSELHHGRTERDLIAVAKRVLLYDRSVHVGAIRRTEVVQCAGPRAVDHLGMMPRDAWVDHDEVVIRLPTDANTALDRDRLHRTAIGQHHEARL